MFCVTNDLEGGENFSLLLRPSECLSKGTTPYMFSKGRNSLYWLLTKTTTTLAL